MITLDGWTKIMYNLMDANISWMAIAFCVSLVLISSFFTLNVILAIIADTQEEGPNIDRKAKAAKTALTIRSLKREAR